MKIQIHILYCLLFVLIELVKYCFGYCIGAF